MNGWAEVRARTTEPPAIARKAPTPPSNFTISTVRPSSLKMPMSCATYGGMCTTLGGVTGIASLTLWLVQTAGFSAEVTGAGAEPHAAATNPTRNTLATLRIISASSSSYFLASAGSACPWGEPALQPLRDGNQQHAHRSDNDHGHEHAVDPECVLVDDDQRAETLPNADQELGQHHSHEGTRDGEADAREYERQRGRDKDIRPQPALAAVE